VGRIWKISGLVERIQQLSGQSLRAVGARVKKRLNLRAIRDAYLNMFSPATEAVTAAEAAILTTILFSSITAPVPAATAVSAVITTFAFLLIVTFTTVIIYRKQLYFALI